MKELIDILESYSDTDKYRSLPMILVGGGSQLLGLKKFLKGKDIKPEEAMLVGDQMMTDVLAARGAHLRMVLTEKIVKEDQFTTHFNRLLDRPIRKHLRKKGKLPDWRTKYGQS